jgi:hypothetical protein
MAGSLKTGIHQQLDVLGDFGRSRFANLDFKLDQARTLRRGLASAAARKSDYRKRPGDKRQACANMCGLREHHPHRLQLPGKRV